MKKGNMNIKNTATYDAATRKKITDLILKEYKALKDKDPDGQTFATHMLQVLTKAGFTAPDGSQLTHRGVRYQVLRSGIGFKGARLIEEQGKDPIVKVSLLRDAPTVIPKPAPQPAVKQAVLESLSSLPALLERIIVDETVTPRQRAALVEAWFEVKK